MSMDIFILERGDSPKRSLASPTVRALKILELNPFGELTQMEFDCDSQWMSYERERALEEITEGSGFVGVRNDEGLWFRGFVTRSKDVQNTAGFRCDHQYVLKPQMPARIIAYLKQWRDVFPAFALGQSDADDRDNDFWMDVAEVEPLPDCFGASWLGWYHLMHPREYGHYFKREDLLAAPAFHVEELADGCIAIQSYEHPLAFADESVTRDIIAITNYLNQRRIDPPLS